MTIIRREYIPQTREFKYKSGNTGGVVNDSNSTTIIVDFPEGYLDDKDAFIAFNVRNPETGQPYWYDFSACSIEIPYEVASKVIQNKLDYQLILVGKDNPNYVEQSFIDTALFVRSIQDYPQIAGSPVPAVVELDMLRYRQSQTVIDALDELKEYLQGLYGETGGGSGGEIDTTYLDNKFSELHNALIQLEIPNPSPEIDQLSSSISSLSSDVQNVQSSVDNVPMQVANALSIPDYSSELSALDSSVDEIRSGISTIDSAVANLPQEVEEHIIIPDYSTTLNEVQSGISAISSDVTSISTNTATVMSEVADVKNRVDSANNGISGVAGTVAGTASMVSDLSEDFQTTSAEISSMHTDINDIPSRVAEAIIIPDYTYSLETINNNTSSIPSSIESVMSDMTTIESDVTTLHSDISSLGDMLNYTLGSPSTSISSILDGLSTDINSSDPGSIKGECQRIQDMLGVTSSLDGGSISGALSSIISAMGEIFTRLSNIESTLSNMGGNP